MAAIALLVGLRRARRPSMAYRGATQRRLSPFGLSLRAQPALRALAIRYIVGSSFPFLPLAVTLCLKSQE